eukprot:9420097-Alexandrium_andersonii.AAC.1
MASPRPMAQAVETSSTRQMSARGASTWSGSAREGHAQVARVGGRCLGSEAAGAVLAPEDAA